MRIILTFNNCKCAWKHISFLFLLLFTVYFFRILVIYYFLKRLLIYILFNLLLINVLLIFIIYFYRKVNCLIFYRIDPRIFVWLWTDLYILRLIFIILVIIIIITIRRCIRFILTTHLIHFLLVWIRALMTVAFYSTLSF